MKPVQVFPLNRIPDSNPAFDPASEENSLYRVLTPGEITMLERQGNRATDWNQVRVAEPFAVGLLHQNEFRGPVRLGPLEPVRLERGSLSLPAGITHSVLSNCVIGANCAIHDVRFLSGYRLEDQVILFDLGELCASPTDTFGVASADSKHAPWIEVWNEAGGRGIQPFPGMRVGDAWIWAKHRADRLLLERLDTLSQEAATRARRRGCPGLIQTGATLLHVPILRGILVGPHACLDGADRLKNVTIESSAEEPAHVGAGADLEDGLVGRGCHVGFGSKAGRFVLAPHVHLCHATALTHSVVGDNSAVECCEVRSSLLFPSHGQHHNNSFLIAVCLEGQSNVAAGSTIGSNHNSRAADGEILARRGFWPGLSTNFKHNSRFASFTLAAKGAYPYEIDLPLPFSLVCNHEAEDCLIVRPAYWFLYNLYALARNAWKFAARDKRVRKDQKIENDYLAPDTIEEIFQALDLLEKWTGEALKRVRQTETMDPEPVSPQTAEGGTEPSEPAPHEGWAETSEADRLDIRAEGIENSRRPVRVLKAGCAWKAYREMAHYYAVRTLLEFMESRGLENLAALKTALEPLGPTTWVNVGGQIMTATDLDALLDGIRTGRLGDWDAIHAEQDRLWEAYPRQKAAHALGALLRLEGWMLGELIPTRWVEALEQARATQFEIAQRTRDSRARDHVNPFRSVTYDSQAEMEAVLGTLEDNAFVQQTAREAEDFARRVESQIERESAEYHD
ncbi:MAG TPA: DUF4954 family protein [Candidatus Sumerlaeota bacterium]|nr:DUF4954 family protein [Candidatus Sumerlaeota bacterium]